MKYIIYPISFVAAVIIKIISKIVYIYHRTKTEIKKYA